MGVSSNISLFLINYNSKFLKKKKLEADMVFFFLDVQDVCYFMQEAQNNERLRS